MKKIIFVLILCLIALFLFGCTQENPLTNALSGGVDCGVLSQEEQKDVNSTKSQCGEKIVLECTSGKVGFQTEVGGIKGIAEFKVEGVRGNYCTIQSSIKVDDYMLSSVDCNVPISKLEKASTIQKLNLTSYCETMKLSCSPGTFVGYYDYNDVAEEYKIFERTGTNIRREYDIKGIDKNKNICVMQYSEKLNDDTLGTSNCNIPLKSLSDYAPKTIFNKNYCEVWINYDMFQESYTDNGDGTVTNNYSGLIWQKDGSSVRLEWAEAKDYCEGLGNGWRLPTRVELETFIDRVCSFLTKGCAGDYINAVFDATNWGNRIGGYWSSTTNSSKTSAYMFSKVDGTMNMQVMNQGIISARCVRSK